MICCDLAEQGTSPVTLLELARRFVLPRAQPMDAWMADARMASTHYAGICVNDHVHLGVHFLTIHQYINDGSEIKYRLFCAVKSRSRPSCLKR